MRFREVQEVVSEDYLKRHPVRKTVYLRLLSMLTELGELSTCILCKEGMRLGKPESVIEEEYADLLMNVLSLGTMLGIDAENAVMQKLCKDISNREQGKT